MKQFFNQKFIYYLRKLIVQDEIMDDVWTTQELIKHHLELAESFDEIRIIQQIT